MEVSGELYAGGSVAGNETLVPTGCESEWGLVGDSVGEEEKISSHVRKSIARLPARRFGDKHDSLPPAPLACSSETPSQQFYASSVCFLRASFPLSLGCNSVTGVGNLAMLSVWV